MTAPTTNPPPHRDGRTLLAQSLAKGAAGTALLHIERAYTGTQTWQTAHTWVQAATTDGVLATDQTGLFYGAPAIAFLLHAAQADGKPRYRGAAAALDPHVTRLTRRRLAAATARIDRGEPATFAEYDAFYGLTGIGALLARHAPHTELLTHVLRYLVRLTQPLHDGLPGWWVSHNPDPILPTPGGHANFGMAHGTAGILAVMATAARRGVTVDGQIEAIDRVCRWLDRWRQDGPTGPWWPQWITRTELHTGRVTQPGPARPSWCYGTPGIARSAQIAAIALGDPTRQHRAEATLAACLADPAQLQLITDPGLCHGIAGLYQTAWRAARDVLTPAIHQQLPPLAERLHHAAANPPPTPGLLDGTAGLDLALHTLAHSAPPHSGWDACLLID